MFRVYFNKHDAYPYVWSFDDGDIANEVLVTAIHGPNFSSHYDPKGDNLNSPRGYFTVTASRALLSNGEVTFYD